MIGKVVQSMPFGYETAVRALSLGRVMPRSTRVLRLVHPMQSFNTNSVNLFGNLYFGVFGLAFPRISEFLTRKLILLLRKRIENVLHLDDLELFHFLSRGLRNENWWWELLLLLLGLVHHVFELQSLLTVLGKVRFHSGCKGAWSPIIDRVM